MSQEISIFVDYPETMDQLASQVERVVPVRFKEFTPDQARFFEARNDYFIVTIGKNILENDRDLNFEDYTYEIEIRAIRNRSYESNEQRTWAEIPLIFSKLQPVLNCRMMLVDNIQKKLADYQPALVSTEQ